MQHLVTDKQNGECADYPSDIACPLAGGVGLQNHSDDANNGIRTMYGTNEGENTNEYADKPAKQDSRDEP
ncbi:hypothetical protein GCM10008985_07500 [Halococcus dombrowskii]|uniref:Uncharacterized protein n=1 Tax=Halococcus dombrowskii TaxID=179637 RepID=A0AAV3SDR1_HALDO